MLLTRFCQEDRIRIPQPHRYLQIKVTKPVGSGNDFVAYLDAIGNLDGSKCLLEWKTSSARYPEEPAGLLALDPNSSAIPGSRGFARWRKSYSFASAWWKFNICTPRSRRRAAKNLVPWSRKRSGASNPLNSPRTAAFVYRRTRAAPVPTWILFGATGSCRCRPRAAARSRRPWLA